MPAPAEYSDENTGILIGVVMSKGAIKAADVETLRKNEAKWSKPLMAAGWNAIPSIIIEKQAALGLDAIDMNIIVHLSNYWWTADNLPHPSVGTIAKAIGITPRTVQKRVKALHELGILVREERRYTKRGSVENLYHFTGLIKAAAPFAEEKLAKIAARAKEEHERLMRKKPRLTLVQSEEK
jgi:predicted transcriptional regulator